MADATRETILPDTARKVSVSPAPAPPTGGPDGRLLRVLHIGNVANNAYNNAKMLRSAGVECDVLCHDYYHIMGCPEWEDGDFEGSFGNQNFPDWHGVRLKGFRRPKWFAQGPMKWSIDYLLARRRGQRFRAFLYWWRLELFRYLSAGHWGGMPIRSRIVGAAHWVQEAWKSLPRKREDLKASFGMGSRAWVRIPRGFFFILLLGPFRILPGNIMRALQWMLRSLRKTGKQVFGARTAALLKSFARGVKGVCHQGLYHLKSFLVKIREKLPRYQARDRRAENLTEEWDSFMARCERLGVEFRETFPDRQPLRVKELGSYFHNCRWMNELFQEYDIVQAYATEPLYFALLNFDRGIGFEHGTLRDIPFGDDLIGQLTALGYSKASHVFITNGDCLESAKRLRLKNFSPMLHPFDEKKFRKLASEAPDLRARYHADHVFICPLRHDWKIKGTDLYIRALPDLQRVFQSKRIVVIFAPWGQEMEKSRSLIRELGCEDLVVWEGPFNRHNLIRMMAAADAVLDQLTLPHFGATAPEAIACGTPVLMSYKQESTAWIVTRPAPIFAVHSVQEIVDALQKAVDPMFLKNYRREAEEWISECHHSGLIVEKHLRAYRAVLGRERIP